MQIDHVQHHSNQVAAAFEIFCWCSQRHRQVMQLEPEEQELWRAVTKFLVAEFEVGPINAH